MNSDERIATEQSSVQILSEHKSDILRDAI